jgi:hypothetical protein
MGPGQKLDDIAIFWDGHTTINRNLSWPTQCFPIIVGWLWIMTKTHIPCSSAIRHSEPQLAMCCIRRAGGRSCHRHRQECSTQWRSFFSGTKSSFCLNENLQEFKHPIVVLWWISWYILKKYREFDTSLIHLCCIFDTWHLYYFRWICPWLGHGCDGLSRGHCQALCPAYDL